MTQMLLSRLFTGKQKPGKSLTAVPELHSVRKCRQAQAVMESEALAKQIDAIVRSLTSEPTEAQRRIAADLLLEIRRLEQLKAIAAGHSNSVSSAAIAGG